MDAARFAFACIALIVICNAERDFRFEDSMAIKQIIRSFTMNDENSVHTRQSTSGHARNCGQPGTKLSLTWTPKTITIGQDLSINLSFVSVTSLATANITLLGYFGNGTSKPVSLNWNMKENCDVIQQYFKCPIQKGVPIYKHFAIKKLEDGLPNGLYTFKVIIDNENKENFICAMITVKIQPP